MTILLAGATGTIGQAVLRELLAQGHNVLCLIRGNSLMVSRGVIPLRCDLSVAGSLRTAVKQHSVSAVISCMASRTGAPRNAWAVDHDAQLALLRETDAPLFVFLSAICVQKPKLAFQHAKLAFEAKLQNSRADWSIVRPTAYFKSLSGQVARVRSGKPFMVFGSGRQTACKPISDRDLACFLVACLTDQDKRNRILPIGGPGPAITPVDQANDLFSLLDRTPRIQHVPPAMMRAFARGFDLPGVISTRMKDKAEFARIAHYYATESMLVWDETKARYDAELTPAYGTDLLKDHYADLLSGRVDHTLGAHAVF